MLAWTPALSSPGRAGFGPCCGNGDGCARCASVDRPLFIHTELLDSTFVLAEAPTHHARHLAPQLVQRVGDQVPAIAVPNVWRRSWKRCDCPSCAAVSARRKRRRIAALSSGPAVWGSTNTRASPLLSPAARLSRSSSPATSSAIGTLRVERRDFGVPNSPST